MKFGSMDGVLILNREKFALLLAMAKSPGIALSRSALLERVWGYDFEGDERTVDVHVRRGLRAKVEEQQKMGRGPFIRCTVSVTSFVRPVNSIAEMAGTLRRTVPSKSRANSLPSADSEPGERGLDE